ncbi:MAG: hypothetical protein HY881_28175 [Deltaproteobacteria bacterium]|nr:hypothetical protein [Deltaproteobacteria bacterium]
MPACPLSTLRRRSCEKPTHDSGSWLVATHYHVGDLHSLPFAGFYRHFRPDPTRTILPAFDRCDPEYHMDDAAFKHGACFGMDPNRGCGYHPVTKAGRSAPQKPGAKRDPERPYFSGSSHGLFIWLFLEPPWIGRSFEDAAYKAGVRVFGAEKFVAGGSTPPAAVRISLSGPESLDSVRRGLTVLSRLLSGNGPASEVIL